MNHYVNEWNGIKEEYEYRLVLFFDAIYWFR